MAAGKVRASHQIGMNGGKHWRWTEQDIKKVTKYKAENYRKGRGRKKKVEKGK
jgi:hypothetical protein